jgi:3-hydroxy-9,10-secoandrosta-1,3,5(10)-triene-9,17-dione monooxygenase reductase component
LAILARVPTEVERQQYRSVIAHFTTGVTVITGLGPDGPAGMTTNAVCSLSLEPVLLLVCFDNDARTLPVVRETGRFAVNILRSDQDAIAEVFATKAHPNEKFDGIGYLVEHGVPLLHDTLAWLVCDLDRLIPGGDHTIGIGRVMAVHHDEGEPLVFYRGGYRGLD